MFDRRAAVLPKLSKATDRDSDVLFSPDEITRIIRGIEEDDLREKLEPERFNRIMAEIEIPCFSRASLKWGV
jgi:hypothetical protein